MAWENIINVAQEWLWLSVIVPVGLGFWPLVKRLLKKYTEGFEEAAGGYLKTSGQATFQRLLSFGFRAQYDQHLIHSFRTYEIQGLKTRGPFTLDLEKVFVPLRIAPESAHNIEQDLLRNSKADKGLSIWDVLAKASKEPNYRRLAVIAAPGAGKTTLMRHLTLIHAKRQQGQYHPKSQSWLPVLLYLRDLSKPISANPDLDLAELIQTQTGFADLKPPPGWFKRQLQKGRSLVLLDGLDEVADLAQRKAISRWVERQMLNYHEACFILTSRPFGFRDAQMEGIGMVLEVQPFNLQQMAQFLANWYLQNEAMRQMRREDAGILQEAARKSEDLKQRILAHSTLAAMAVNPLLLTMIATVHDNRGALPGRRVELYGEICDVLLGRRQEAKGLADVLTALQKQRVLQALALALMETGKRSFTLAEGSRHIADRLARVDGSDAKGEEFLGQIENLSGLLVQRELGVYEFVHKSFQEYLAAVEIKDASLTDYLLDKLTDTAWEETIRLYAVQANDASALLEAMLNNPTAAGLALAYDCQEEGTEVSPALRQALQERVELGLESDDAAIAKQAAQVKLMQRLRRLTPLDDGVFIDSSLLTCAEYQLFIDDCRQRNEVRKPDHWLSERFEAGMAREAIAGVRAEDTLAFCLWLGEQYPEAGVSYRLPTPQESMQMPADDLMIGHWCVQDQDRFVIGVSSLLIEQAGNLLGQQLADRFNFARTQDRILDRAIVRACDRYNVYGSGGFNRYLDRAHDLERTRSFLKILDLERSRILARDLKPALDRAFDFKLEHARSLNLDLDISLYQVGTRNFEPSKLNELLSLCSKVLLVLCLIRETSKHKNGWHGIFTRKQTHSPQYIDLITCQAAILELWTFYAIINERQQGNLPAWEGIRIVKERTSKI